VTDQLLRVCLTQLPARALLLPEACLPTCFTTKYKQVSEEAIVELWWKSDTNMIVPV
jgi:hypothetical protein